MPGALNHTPAYIVSTLMVSHGLGTSPSANGSWPVYDAREPDYPDDCVTVYTTTGVVHSRAHPDGELAEHYGVQVRVRSAADNSGYAKANAIDEELLKQVYDEAVTISGSSYCVHSFTRSGQINSLGVMAPDDQRTVHTVNYLIRVRKDSA